MAMEECIRMEVKADIDDRTEAESRLRGEMRGLVVRCAHLWWSGSRQEKESLGFKDARAILDEAGSAGVVTASGQAR